MARFDGKRSAAVTGGASGIGRGPRSGRFVAEGASVAFCDRGTAERGERLGGPKLEAGRRQGRFHAR